MQLKKIIPVFALALPLTFFEVNAAGSSLDQLKDTIIDKTIHKIEEGFNSLLPQQ